MANFWIRAAGLCWVTVWFSSRLDVSVHPFCWHWLGWCAEEGLLGASFGPITLEYDYSRKGV